MLNHAMHTHRHLPAPGAPILQSFGKESNPQDERGCLTFDVTERNVLIQACKMCVCTASSGPLTRGLSFRCGNFLALANMPWGLCVRQTCSCVLLDVFHDELNTRTSPTVWPAYDGWARKGDRAGCTRKTSGVRMNLHGPGAGYRLRISCCMRRQILLSVTRDNHPSTPDSPPAAGIVAGTSRARQAAAATPRARCPVDYFWSKPCPRQHGSCRQGTETQSPKAQQDGDTRTQARQSGAKPQPLLPWMCCRC